MTIKELIVILENRMLALTEARKTAVNSGDAEKVVQIDHDLLTTEQSLTALRNL
jgi:hypothetical protein